ncbi:hypothetical protein FB451DRAFT_1194718 [Mycena latifolia]|nr:hypothetical protein FB451DRAFT_1194718 [Mycena latifolia]
MQWPVRNSSAAVDNMIKQTAYPTSRGLRGGKRRGVSKLKTRAEEGKGDRSGDADLQETSVQGSERADRHGPEASIPSVMSTSVSLHSLPAAAMRWHRHTVAVHGGHPARHGGGGDEVAEWPHGVKRLQEAACGGEVEWEPVRREDAKDLQCVLREAELSTAAYDFSVSKSTSRRGRGDGRQSVRSLVERVRALGLPISAEDAKLSTSTPSRETEWGGTPHEMKEGGRRRWWGKGRKLVKFSFALTSRLGTQLSICMAQYKSPQWGFFLMSSAMAGIRCHLFNLNEGDILFLGGAGPFSLSVMIWVCDQEDLRISICDLLNRSLMW